MLAENLGRDDLTAAEVAEAVYQMKLRGHAQAEVAKRLAKSQAWVSRALKLREQACTALFKAVADVCAYDNATWGPPLFIAEHENANDIERVKYCAWKLLITEAARRVLVAYYPPKVGFDGLVKAVREVAEANGGQERPRDVLVIAAPWDAKPASLEALRSLFQSQIVGKL